MYWYKKAAVQGSAEAQFNIGSLYYLGEGVTKNYEEALKWYEKAAIKGHETSQYQVGE